MAGRGAAPTQGARHGHTPRQRGDWQRKESTGWQHGDTPACPPGLLKPSREAWSSWMSSWFAAFWTVEDLPALRQIVRLYDQVERGEFQRMNELRLQMDTYGMTPKGQQDRRWAPPIDADVEAERAAESSSGEAAASVTRLRVAL